MAWLVAYRPGSGPGRARETRPGAEERRYRACGPKRPDHGWRQSGLRPLSFMAPGRPCKTFRYRHRLPVLWALLSAPTPGEGDERPACDGNACELTLEDAVGLALERNRPLFNRRLDREVRRFSLDVDEGCWNPQAPVGPFAGIAAVLQRSHRTLHNGKLRTTGLSAPGHGMSPVTSAASDGHSCS